MTEVIRDNLTNVSFPNQEQLYYSNWRDVVKGRGYRSFTQKALTGERMTGGGVQACSIHLQYMAALPRPFSSAMSRRKNFPGLVGMASTSVENRLAIRAAQYATANAVLVECGDFIKRQAKTQGAQSTAAHIWVNQAWLALEPVLKQREEEPERLWPKIMRTRPLSDIRTETELKTGHWKHWTVHYAPWCLDFKVTDITMDAPHDVSRANLLAVNATSQALDFMASYAPFSFISCMESYAEYKGGDGVAMALKLLEKMAALYGPERCRAAYDDKQLSHAELVRSIAVKSCTKAAKEKTLEFQRLNRAERYRQIREEKAQLLMVAPKYRDKARLEALKSEAAKLNFSPYSSIPLTEAQELEIQAILDRVEKLVDAA